MASQWQVGKLYQIGDIVQYQGNLYQCRISHTSQADWAPSVYTQALWTQISSPPQPSPGPVVPSPPIQPQPSPQPSPGPVVPSPPNPVPYNKATNGTLLAPYLYTWGLGNTAYQISSCMDVVNKVKGNAVTMAFVIGDSTGNMSQDINAFADDFKKFAAVKGQLIISFGGANGPYIQDILTVDQMVNQISKLLTATGCRAIDFDIEGGEIGNMTAITNLCKALVQLQKQFTGLYTSFTLAADTSGIPYLGINALKAIIANNVNISIVNIMAMDIGQLPSGQNWGQVACAMGETTVAQLKTLYPGRSTGQLYSMLGITPMIGRNDDSSVFTPADATTLATYAKQKSIGLLSFWAINRDQTGTGSLGIYSQANTTNFQFFNNMKTALGSLGTLSNSSTQPIPIMPQPPIVNPPATKGKYDVIYYYGDWDTYSINYQIADIPITKVPSINYAFYNMTADGTVVSPDSYADYLKAFTNGGVAPPDTWQDNLPYHGNFQQLNKLRQQGNKFNLSLSIGGWTLSRNFSIAMSTDATRQNAVKSIITTL